MVISNYRQMRLKSVPGRRQQLMIKRMIYKYSGKDVRSLGANMGSPGINYYRLKQLENVTDKSYLDFSEVPPQQMLLVNTSDRNINMPNKLTGNIDLEGITNVFVD